MPQTHATLSASGAHRWINCTPSALLEKDLPDTTSEAAKQGTAAHALAEHKLLKALGRKTRKPRSKYIDTEMEELTDAYVDHVMEVVAQTRKTCPDATVLVEQKLDFSNWVPDGFGTGDCVIVAEPNLHIIDLKYGQGIMVDSDQNPQMMLYALGALATFSMLYHIKTVTMTIYQPRRDNISTATINVPELEEWAINILEPAAEQAARGDGQQKPGEWCRFCRVGPTCKARAEKNLELTGFKNEEPKTLTDGEIGDILARLPELKAWAAQVEKYALEEAVAGRKTWPGHKLVEGRSIRRVTDPDALAEKLLANDWAETDIFEKKLLGLTLLEKRVGKKQLSSLAGDLIIKPSGKPTLVPESDKRPPISLDSAVDDFDTQN